VTVSRSRVRRSRFPQRAVASATAAHSAASPIKNTRAVRLTPARAEGNCRYVPNSRHRAMPAALQKIARPTRVAANIKPTDDAVSSPVEAVNHTARESPARYRLAKTCTTALTAHTSSASAQPSRSADTPTRIRPSGPDTTADTGPWRTTSTVNQATSPKLTPAAPAPIRPAIPGPTTIAASTATRGNAITASSTALTSGPAARPWSRSR